MSRKKLYEILSTVCKTDISQKLKGNIKENTVVIERTSALASMTNTISGWQEWVIFIYCPYTPLKMDQLRKDIIKALVLNNIEVMHEMREEYYDEEMLCYVSSVSCRMPSTYYYRKEGENHGLQN